MPLRDRRRARTRVVAGGGLTRNRMLMQIYADVLGIEIEVAGASQASGTRRGDAGRGGGRRRRQAGHASIEEAAAAMAPMPTERYHCDRAAHERYTALYRLYVDLYDHFGRGNDLMHRLRELR